MVPKGKNLHIKMSLCIRRVYSEQTLSRIHPSCTDALSWLLNGCLLDVPIAFIDKYSNHIRVGVKVFCVLRQTYPAYYYRHFHMSRRGLWCEMTKYTTISGYISINCLTDRDVYKVKSVSLFENKKFDNYNMVTCITVFRLIRNFDNDDGKRRWWDVTNFNANFETLFWN